MPRARKYDLTWFPPNKCWRKFYGQKTYYLGKRQCKGKTDRDGYLAALAEWQELKARLDGQTPTQTAAKIPTGPVSAVPAPKAPDVGRSMVASIQETAQASGLSPQSLLEAALLSRRNQAPPIPQESKEESTTSIGRLVRRYLSERELLVHAGERSAVAYGEYRERMRQFLGVAAAYGLTEISQIATPGFIDTYRRDILHRMSLGKAEGGIGGVDARKRLSFYKWFIEWAYRKQHLETLPRELLDKRFAKVTPDAQPLKFYSVEECRELFKLATPRGRLLICLGLNFAWLPTDIGSATHDCVDWSSNTISTKRHKTGVPTVYRMWSVTARLLRQQMTKAAPGELLLRTAGGSPLYYVDIRGGKAVKCDNVVQVFNRARRQAWTANTKTANADLFANGVDRDKWRGNKKRIRELVAQHQKADGRGFKFLRKSAANMIHQHFQQDGLTDMFLGHVERASRRWYVENPTALLFSAIDWLDSQFKLGDLL